MFGLGFIEIIVIVIVVLLAVKPEDLPNFFKKIGNSYKELKKTMSEVKSLKDDFVSLAEEGSSTINTASKKIKEKTNVEVLSKEKLNEYIPNELKKEK